jgi:hypothetical protein
VVSTRILNFIEFSPMLEYTDDLDINELKAERKALHRIDREYILNRFKLK